MFVHFVGLILLAAQQESVAPKRLASASPTNLLSQESSPSIPLEPDRGGYYLMSGLGLGSLTTPRFGGGWCFLANCSRAIWCSPGSIASACVYRKLIVETEGYRCCLTGGSQCGIQNEWYLGYGFAAAIDLNCPLESRHPGILQLSLDCYAWDGTVFSFVLDPLGGGCAFVGALLIDPEETAHLLPLPVEEE